MNPYELERLPLQDRNRHEADPVRSARQIVSVVAGSIAAELGLKPGDELLEVNGRRIKDVFDYRLAVLDSELLMLFRLASGELVEFEISKDEDEDPGLEFAEAMMDDPTRCHNKCLFCFIDQLPPGMRETLYFKDDDMRLSFLSGNYITLTNIKDEELDRLIAYRLSPMNVSVHTTDPELRRQMLCNRFAAGIMEKLRRIADAGIEINCQIVLVPGVNDAEHLDRTLADLASLGDALSSVAIVPVGITRYRDELKLPLIRPVDAAAAEDLLSRADHWQTRFMGSLGRRVVFPADEFYLLARREIPPAAAYEGFPQLENGIGLLSLFREEVTELIAETDPQKRSDALTVHAPVGTAARDFLRPYAQELAARYGVALEMHAIRNEFFGESITVTGLLTGQDILAQLKPVVKPEEKNLVLIPDVCLRSGTEVFLDDMTVRALAKALAVPVKVVTADARGLASGLREEENL